MTRTPKPRSTTTTATKNQPWLNQLLLEESHSRLAILVESYFCYGWLPSDDVLADVAAFLVACGSASDFVLAAFAFLTN
jgi:hypothetical protein